MFFSSLYARAIWIPLATAVLVSGCAQFPELQKSLGMKQPLDYAAAQSFAAAARAWPQERWWQGYGDAQLDALIEEGLRGAPSLASAEARLRQAEAMSRIAGAANLPQVSADASVTSQKQSYNYLSPQQMLPQGWKGYAQTTLDFSWELDFWGKNREALAAALSVQQAALADAAQARLTLATSIASAYAELARLFAARDTALEVAQVRAQNLELIRKRYDNGLEILSAVREAQTRRAAAEGDTLALDEQIGLQRNRLAALIGAGPDRGLAIQRPQIKLQQSFGLPAHLQLELLGRRPDVVAARMLVEAAKHAEERQKTEFYPNVNLAAMIGLQSLGVNMLTKSGSDFGSIGPAVSLPIFSGGRLEGELLGAHAGYDGAVASYNTTVTQAMQDVANVAVSSKAFAPQLAKAEEAVAAARDAHRLAQMRYTGGLANYLDVLSAEETLLSSKRSLNDMQARAFSLDVALIKALGGGYESRSEKQ